MRHKRFFEEQIIGVLKEAEAGAKTDDLVRRHGVSDATICNWKAKYGGLEVSEARLPRELERGNAKLKRLLADQRRRFGYRRLHILLRREGVMINRKKTQRLYREERLAVRRRPSRKGCCRDQSTCSGGGAAEPVLEP
jgi:putative transposase